MILTKSQMGGLTQQKKTTDVKSVGKIALQLRCDAHTRSSSLIVCRARRNAPKSVTMGCIMSICESTPDVPANIIADPEVRTHYDDVGAFDAIERE